MEDRGVCECHDVYYAVDNGDYQVARREVPECSVLEVGGVDATCRVSECYGNEVSVAEPILFEDIIDYNVTAPLFGAVETGVIKQSPGELWLHVRDEWHKEEVLKDINEAIARQLRERRAVVFQRDTKEAALWEAIGTGWENDGYRVNHDFIDDNTAIVRVCWPEVDNEVHVNEVMAGEAAEGSGGNFRGAKAIRFPAGVPNHIASGLRRLHQNLSHPSTSDLVRHLRLAGARIQHTGGKPPPESVQQLPSIWTTQALGLHRFLSMAPAALRLAILAGVPQLRRPGGRKFHSCKHSQHGKGPRVCSR